MDAALAAAAVVSTFGGGANVQTGLGRDLAAAHRAAASGPSLFRNAPGDQRQLAQRRVGGCDFGSARRAAARRRARRVYRWFAGANRYDSVRNWLPCVFSLRAVVGAQLARWTTGAVSKHLPSRA